MAGQNHKSQPRKYSGFRAPSIVKPPPSKALWRSGSTAEGGDGAVVGKIKVLLLDTIGYYLILVDTGGGRRRGTGLKHNILTPAGGRIWWQSVPSQCLRAFLHFGSVPGGGGWYALKSGFGPMFTGLGTAVRFEKQGLKLRREFSRISNIPG